MSKSIRALLLVLFISVSGLIGCGGTGQIGRLSSGEPLPRSRYSRVVLVPLGDFPVGDAKTLADRLQQQLDLKIEVQKSVKLKPSARDADRKQWVAEALIQQMQAQQRGPVRNDDVVRIGLTTEDMFTREAEWQYVLYQAEGHNAVISMFRMDPTNLGIRPDPLLLETRQNKLLLRTIGQIVYGLPPGDAPDSVLAGTVLSVSDLDALGSRL